MGTKTTRSEILQEADRLVSQDRHDQYGSAEDNLQHIAKMWGLYVGKPITSIDVAVMLTLMKISRVRSNPKHADNFIDACGYMALAGELAGDAE